LRLRWRAAAGLSFQDYWPRDARSNFALPEVNGLFSGTGQASWEYIGRGSTPRRPAEIEQAISQLRVFARPRRSAARLSGTLGGADYKPKLSLAE